MLATLKLLLSFVDLNVMKMKICAFKPVFMCWDHAFAISNGISIPLILIEKQIFLQQEKK